MTPKEPAACCDNLGGPGGPHSCIYCGDFLPCGEASRLASPPAIKTLNIPVLSLPMKSQNERAWEDLRDDGGLPESQPVAASPPATQETIVDFLRTRAKSHRAIGEADGDIRSDECEALADELSAHPLATSPPAKDSLETRFVDTFTQLARNQHALDPEAAKVLYDNLWSLYDDSDPNEPNITLAASPLAITVNDFVCAVGEMTNADALQRVEELVRLSEVQPASPPEMAPVTLTINEEAQAALTTLSLLMEWPSDTSQLRTCQRCFERLRAAHGSRPTGTETETDGTR